MINKLSTSVFGKRFVLDYERRMSFQKIRLFDHAIQFDIPSLLNVDLGLQLYRIKKGVVTHWVEHDMGSKFDQKAFEFFKEPNNGNEIERMIQYVNKSLDKLQKFSKKIPNYSMQTDEVLLSEYKEFCAVERELSLMNQLLFLYFEKALTESLKLVLGDSGANQMEMLSLQTKVIPLDVYYLDICSYLLNEVTEEELYKKYAHFGKVDVNDKSLAQGKLQEDCDMIKKKDPKLVRKSIERKYQENKVKVNNVLSKIESQAYISMLIKYYRTYSNKKEWKNFVREMSSYKLAQLLAEIAKRRSVTLEELSYLTEEEICKIMTGTMETENVGLRKEDSLYIIYHDEIQVIEDLKMLDEIDVYLSNKDLDLKGETACPGKASGRVCIILSNQDFDKFKDGDVIVAPTTRPDYVPFMLRASAIVTNEGGILSHAAILSRELKKPCIIGTRTATTALNDGDFVEVDADECVIKLIK